MPYAVILTIYGTERIIGIGLNYMHAAFHASEYLGSKRMGEEEVTFVEISEERYNDLKVQFPQGVTP